MKKFIKKLAKKTEGFTLVELIVVIAILGVLAGVAVPAYTGYLTKANEASDITQLDAIKTAVQATVASKGAPTKIEVDVTSAKVSDVKVSGVDVTGDGTADTSASIWANADFKLYMTGSTTGTPDITLKSETYKTNGADWTSTGWVAGAAAAG